jgi:hypothetical protein
MKRPEIRSRNAGQAPIEIALLHALKKFDSEEG